MKAVVISKNPKQDTSIKKCVANSSGISNLKIDLANHKFTFEFSTHNAMEGLREKLMAFGFAIEFIYL